VISREQAQQQVQIMRQSDAAGSFFYYIKAVNELVRVNIESMSARVNKTQQNPFFGLIYSTGHFNFDQGNYDDQSSNA